MNNTNKENEDDILSIKRMILARKNLYRDIEMTKSSIEEIKQAVTKRKAPSYEDDKTNESLKKRCHKYKKDDQLVADMPCYIAGPNTSRSGPASFVPSAKQGRKYVIFHPIPDNEEQSEMCDSRSRQTYK